MRRPRRCGGRGPARRGGHAVAWPPRAPRSARVNSLADLIPGGLRRLAERVAERGHQRAQGLARDQLRDDGVGPHRLVGVGDQVPP